jgi:hypothetical protein
MKKTLRDRIAAFASMNPSTLREERRKVFGRAAFHSQRRPSYGITRQSGAGEDGRTPIAVCGEACGSAQSSLRRNLGIRTVSRGCAGLPAERRAVARMNPAVGRIWPRGTLSRSHDPVDSKFHGGRGGRRRSASRVRLAFIGSRLAGAPLTMPSPGQDHSLLSHHRPASHVLRIPNDSADRL